jgi:ABC-2 type transport system permease protein
MSTGEDGTRRNGAREDRARLWDLIAAEWIRLRSLRSTYPVLLGIALVVLAGAAYSASRLNLSPFGRRTFDPAAMPFSDDMWGAVLWCAAALGGMTLAGEYASGLIRTTLIAVPDRRRLVLAKAVVLSAVMGTFGTVLATASLVVSQLALPDQELPGLADYPGLVKDVVASGVVLAVAAVVGLAIGAVVRNTVASVVVAAIVLSLAPDVLRSGTGPLSMLARSLPRHAWDSLVPHNGTAGSVGYLPGAAGAWLSCAGWLLGAAAVAAAALCRDA